MGFLTGKSKGSSSSNRAYDYLKGALSPLVSQGTQASGQIGSLLGLGGDTAAANAAYDQFKNASGYQNIFNESIRGVTNSAAGRGLLGSGATARGLQTTGANLAQQSFGNYLSQLQNMLGSGLQGASIIGGAGAESKGGSSKPGLLSIFSDRRVKKNIEKVGETIDGLGIYKYHYLNDRDDAPKRLGVMAQEVAEKRPNALGPEVAGFHTVNYGAL